MLTYQSANTTFLISLLIGNVKDHLNTINSKKKSAVLNRYWHVTLMVSMLLLLLCACQQSNNRAVSFNKDIRPILNEKCLRCHGGVKANGGFSLLFEEDAFAPTESGKPAIVRGSHRQSELYQRLVYTDPELRMPFESEPLDTDEIELIARWIDAGAIWEKHWAYVAPSKDIDPPPVVVEWMDQDIDRFVAAQFSAHGLSANAPAEKAVILRRLCLDLIGLPPSMEEAQTFLEDHSEHGYEDLVDRLLANPHFGEKWAAMWLDLARYADTKGYEKDSNRSIWKYRDWVINAFNDDLPYDSFTILQLAGDLLPTPTTEQLIATAFHRNAMSNDEGGTDDEEFRVASIIERVSTTYEVWQATTMACVQCHSHPYDPFRQEEYYQSMAFFNNTADKDIYNEHPKLYTYPTAHVQNVKETVAWIEEKVPHLPAPSENGSLFDRTQDLLHALDYRIIEAEDFAHNSPLIELIWPDLDMLWQVQDSSWVKYESVDLTDVVEFGFKAATSLGFAGSISIHLDSLEGEKIGQTKIFRTGEWDGWQGSRPPHDHLFKEFIATITPVTGFHDVYLRFGVGDTYIQHLFYLDKIILHEQTPRYKSLSRALQNELKALYHAPAHTTPILQELPPGKSRKTHFFNRGSWLMPEHEVATKVPGIFAIGDEEPQDRLSFARWLVSEHNPLTARVMVNRLWEQLFGQGLVESMEEFGSQGAVPSHPALLDWMAVRFSDYHQWHIKAMIKEMVMSATYRQSSAAPEEKIALDPNNQWLARGPRIRLSSEQIRDQILTLSGLLNPGIGGPSVIMPQLNVGESKIPYYAITGDSALYRRTLYTYWKRTDPFPSVMTFDSPDRTVCSSRRIRTNTPLQALNLLNNETYFKASESLATQMLNAKKNLADQIDWCYRRFFHQKMPAEDLQVLTTLFRESQQHYIRENGHSVKNQQLAMTLVANALFNLDKFIVKE
ncbi:MAG: DUF1553 domain-containing protein [Saprospiraceae bacterium]|nr:DUF1553 domain-containing protein [Saprospiraceae bacterium]